MWLIGCSISLKRSLSRSPLKNKKLIALKNFPEIHDKDFPAVLQNSCFKKGAIDSVSQRLAGSLSDMKIEFTFYDGKNYALLLKL